MFFTSRLDLQLLGVKDFVSSIENFNQEHWPWTINHFS